jgi:ADP-ribosylglycohydrolase
MTLALAYSFVESEMQYNHIMSIKFYVEWMTHGRFSTIDRAWDMGYSTRKALSIWKKSRMENIEGAQARIDVELDSEERSGNGSLMRIVPVGVAYWRDGRLAREVARVQGRVTHPSLPCVEACEAYTELVCGVMNGKSFDFDDIDWFQGFILMFLARSYQAAIV